MLAKDLYHAYLRVVMKPSRYTTRLALQKQTKKAQKRHCKVKKTYVEICRFVYSS